MGDPSGIGPEVVLKALASPKVKGLADFLIIGDRSVLEHTARDTRSRLFARILDMANVPKKGFAYGKPGPSSGRAPIRYLDMALELLANDEADALVTAPINKSAIKNALLPNFQGHTEYLAETAGAKKVAMMFVGKDLKVVPVTRHVPLKRVPSILNSEEIFDTIVLTRKYLKEYFMIKAPRIAVCGLNPHAGEKGAFGDEEKRIIAPAIKKASKNFKAITGPIPSDAAFYDALNGKYDAVIAMYHDQALVPFKMLYFDTGVNLTLGLPFVRTSPDHGTAYNIAGKGIADPTSMIEAIKLACSLCSHRPS